MNLTPAATALAASTCLPPDVAESITVVMDATEPVPEGALALSNVGTSAMIQVGGRPAIFWTLTWLTRLGVSRFIVAVPRRGMFIADFIDCLFGGCGRFEFIVAPNALHGPGGTLNDLAARVATERALLVAPSHMVLSPSANEAAELFALPAKGGGTVAVGMSRECRAYGVAKLDALNDVCAFEPPSGHSGSSGQRGSSGPSDALAIGTPAGSDAADHLEPVAGHAVLGHAVLPTETLRLAALDHLRQAQRDRRPATVLGVLAQALQAGLLRAVSVVSWRDAADASSIDRAAQAFEPPLQKRSYNDLRIDPLLGTITKRSRQPEKFVDEINYQRLLPSDVALMFPRIVDFSTEWADPWVRLEYYGYPPLSQLFLFENIAPNVWERAFAHLKDVLTHVFGRHRQPLERGLLTQMYFHKTRERLLALPPETPLGQLARFEGEVCINGERLPNFPRLWDRLESAVEALARWDTATIIHGDMCFSNVLYDVRNHVMKLIDPRGSFGKPGIFGDPRYDLAKLWHSVDGYFDFLANDLYSLSVNAADLSDLTLRIRAQAHHKAIAERFERVFFRDADPTLRSHVDLIVALLFTSMVALHTESERRQIALYAHSLRLLNSALSSR